MRTKKRRTAKISPVLSVAVREALQDAQNSSGTASLHQGHFVTKLPRGRYRASLAGLTMVARNRSVARWFKNAKVTATLARDSACIVTAQREAKAIDSIAMGALRMGVFQWYQQFDYRVPVGFNGEYPERVIAELPWDWEPDYEARLAAWMELMEKRVAHLMALGY